MKPIKLPCKVCGANPKDKWSPIQKVFPIDLGNVVEFLCWGCIYWLRTGQVMPTRRIS